MNFLDLLNKNYETWNSVIIVLALIMLMVFFAIYSVSVIQKTRSRNVLAKCSPYLLFVVSTMIFCFVDICTVTEESGYIMYTSNFVLRTILSICVCLTVFMGIDFILWFTARGKKTARKERVFIEEIVEVKKEEIKVPTAEVKVPTKKVEVKKESVKKTVAKKPATKKSTAKKQTK